LEDGPIELTAVNGESGLSGVLPLDNKRGVASRTTFRDYSAMDIDAVNKVSETQPRLPPPHRGQRRWPSSTFAGTAIDPGTNVSTHGKDQKIAFEAHIARKFLFFPALGHVASMAGRSSVLGKIKFSFPVVESAGTFLSHEADGDAPILLGSFDLTRLGLSLDTSTRTLVGHGLRLTLSYDRGHWFLMWQSTPTDSMFTEQELIKLHTRFGHPGTKKLFEFLSRASPDDVDSTTKNVLKRIAERCRACAPSRPAPRIFRTRTPHDGVYFNAEIIVDIFFLAGKPVLSVVDLDTRYQSAIFLPTGTKSLDVWQALLRCWICRYAGAPDSIRTEYGSQFVAAEFKVLSAAMNISCSAVPVESAHSMGIGERYYGPIGRIFERLRLAHPRAPKNLLLDISVKTCNDLTGVDALVPTLLVCYPRLPLKDAADGAVPLSERMRMTVTARDEYSRLVDDLRLKTAQSVQSATHPTDLAHSDPVMVYRTGSR
jgi:hypothetical protein